MLLVEALEVIINKVDEQLHSGSHPLMVPLKNSLVAQVLFNVLTKTLLELRAALFEAYLVLVDFDKVP